MTTVTGVSRQGQPVVEGTGGLGPSAAARRQLRVLVVVANHGWKNLRHLDRLLAAYRRLPHRVRVVLLSDAPKVFGSSDIEVLVGAPTPDPMSLPFGHRQVFADRVDDHDVFVYSEDDTLLEAHQLEAFLELSDLLPPDRIPGFMRYEVDPAGDRSYCTLHSHYRWLPGSVERHGGLTFAQLSNAHGACYAVTRSQLIRAIRSGGFLVEPHCGEYEILESAATDVYTRCGMQKVFCLERLEDQLLHHLPNIYIGQLGITDGEFRAQVDVLRALPRGADTAPLVPPEVRGLPPRWNRHAWPAPSAGLDALVRRLSGRARPHVLSVGTVSGRPEAQLRAAGMRVSAIPLDPTWTPLAASRGFQVLPAGRAGLVQAASGRADRPEVALLLDLLHRAEDPTALLRQVLGQLAPGGTVIATTPDHARYAAFDGARRDRRRPLPRTWDEHGAHRTSAGVVSGWFRAAGMGVTAVRHRLGSTADPVGLGGARGAVGNLLVVAGRAPRR